MRQYIATQNLDSDGFLTISGKDFRYLKSILRLSVGDMLHVRLLGGVLQEMTVCKIDEKSKKISLQICDSKASSSENLPTQNSLLSSCEFTLFMALPKSSKFDQIVRQATECGITKIIPVQTEFSQKGSEKINFRSERFERIIKEARQQSGSPVETKIEPCVSLKTACELWKSEVESLKESESLAIVLYERNDFTVSVCESVKNKENLKKIALFCGSEGGLSPEEIKLLCSQGFSAVHLKTNILRCETAAIYGIAALQTRIFS